MMKKYLFLIAFFSMASGLMAQQFVYKPLNPAFGGDTFNYNWLLSSATSQNGLSNPNTRRDQDSELEQFGNNLNRQILSRLSRALLDQQIEGIGGLTEPGTFTFGDLAVEVFESDEGLVINILDTTNGEQTQVVVPN